MPRWSVRPDLVEVMLECVEGRSNAEAAAEFTRRTGVPLCAHNVSAFKGPRGLGDPTRMGRHSGKQPLPLGTERAGTEGYIMVKVRERPTVPGSKDDWEPKSKVVYEEAYGPLPEGHFAMFCDGDKLNFDPGNLLAVPRRLIGVMNSGGVPWHDRETAKTALMLAELKAARTSVMCARERTCECCGKAFTVDDDRRYNPDQQTCPEYIAAGRKSRGRRKEHTGPPSDVCPVCGREFHRERRQQRRCRSCIDEAPKYSVKAHRSVNASRGCVDFGNR